MENANGQIVSTEDIILSVRGVQIIIDRDLAVLYGVETKRLNQQANRNSDRFPDSFRFQLTKEEKEELVAKCNRFESLKHSSSLPYAFSEQGVAMLSAVLHTSTAVQVSVKIMEAFVAMRRFLVSNGHVFQRLERIEYKLNETDHRFEEVYSRLEEKALKPRQGLFFDGQVFDAYEFICSLIRSANDRIVLIDNYVDDTVLTMMDKRSEGVPASIYTQKVNKQLKQDLEKHNAQYPTIGLYVFTKSHDRFLVIDNQVYLVGASLKDLGRKWFAVCLLSEIKADELLLRLSGE